MYIILLFIIGFLGSTVGSLAGLGGGFIIVPSLLFLGGNTSLLPDITPQVAVGTSIIIIIFIGFSSTLSYMKQGKVDFLSGFIFFIGSGPGAYLGSFLNQRLDVELFYLGFGCLLIMIAISLMVTNKLTFRFKRKGLERVYKDNTGNQITYYINIPIAITFSFVVGILSGLFGIGGGALMVPLMLVVFNFPASLGVATSMFLVLLSAVAGSIGHIQQGNVAWIYTLALVPGAWLGAKFGVWVNGKLNELVFLRVFRVLILLIGIRMIFT